MPRSAMIAQFLLGIGIVYLSWSLIAMEINYRRAASMGIPLVRLPVDPKNILWMVLEPSIWRLLDHLPFDWGTFRRYSRRGWHFHDKARSHLQYGPVWALVTPCDIYVHVVDSVAITDIFHRRGDFLRPNNLYKMLEIYGPCITSADSKDWPRHRKILAAPFNETTMKFVWTQSLKQARQMVQSWEGTRGPCIPSVAKDTRTLSLNVLAATGFRRPYDFRSSSQPGVDEAGKYRNALQTVLDNALLLMLVPPRFLRLPFLPDSWTRLGKAAAAFKQYMERMLDEETSLLDRGEKGTGSLMTAFVRALDTQQKEQPAVKDSDGRSSKGLTRDEIFSDIFVINFAGHDTTANSLAFTMILLAANPEVQDWVAEEVREITKDRGSDEWKYDELFPSLKRSQAILLETLRIYPPTLALPKWSNEHPQTLRVGEREIVFPPLVGVMPSILAAQTHPRHWPNPLLWQPTRWISTSPNADDGNANGDLAARLREETLIKPVQGTYFPWSDGPQNCPGEKFAQVEFVAVLACILRDHRVRILPRADESFEKARERAYSIMEDCDFGLLLRMRNPDAIQLACGAI